MFLLNLLEGEGASFGSFIPMIILLAVIVLFMVMSGRSNKKKKAEAAEMMSKFRKGCHVKTIGGIIGKVVAINDNDGTFILETGSNKQKCLIKFDRQAIYQVTEGKKQATKTVDEDYYGEEPEEVETAVEDIQPVEATIESVEPVETSEQK